MNIVIIGNGISGVTTARHLRKHTNHSITIISEETPYFFSRTALMYVYMGHLRPEHTQPYEPDFWKKNRIGLVQATVKTVDFERKTLQLTSGNSISYDKLVLATGSKPSKLGCLGETLAGVQGLYSWQDLETLEAHTPTIETAVVVGGGLIGIELCEMLLARQKKVVFLVRESSFWRHVVPQEEAGMLTNHIRMHGVDLQLSTEVAEIRGNASHQVEAVVTKQQQQIAAQWVGVAIGVQPNIQFLRETALATDRGILVDELMQTNLPDVYAVGDCVQHRNPPANRRAVEQIWYSGREMGEALADTLAGKPTAYAPNIYFNSAKFFDIEYQTYGFVPANCPDTHGWLLWQHPTDNLLMRLVYLLDKKQVTGVHTFGIRQRQVVWQDWISSQKTIDYVIQHLEAANFDPEFSRRHEAAMRTAFLQQLPSKN